MTIFFVLLFYTNVLFQILGNGEILEFDTPDALLTNPNSHFTSLIEQAGKAESEHLRKVAKNVTSTARLRRKSVDQDKNLPACSIETDPLLD
jgi:ABC-type proline/glycine betaine transport system ATPase subunit